MRWTRTVVAASLAAALTGCATTEPAAVLAGGPRMIDLYRGTAAEPAPEVRGAPQAPQAPEQAVPEAPKGAVVEATCRWGWFRWPCEADAPPPPAACACGDAPGYARTAANELELLFPRLPNPDIYMYVPAHLATELRIPVPGYTTAVPLYDRVEYALPGEADAARFSSEGPPGASSDETGSGASPVEAQPDVSPGEARADSNPEEVQPGASAEETPFGASAEKARSGANPEVWLGTSPVEVPPGVSPEEVPPGVSPEEAGPGASMEEAP